MTGISHPQCTRCSKLLMDYIAAASELVDARRRLPAEEASTPELEEVLERRSTLRKRLALHQEIHSVYSRSSS